MTGRITVAGAKTFGQQIFGRPSEPPAAYYLALVRQISPTVFNTGNELDEVSGLDTGYARVEIPNTPGQWASQSTNRINSQDLPFGYALVEWGVIKYWALCSQPTAGDVLAYGTLTQPIDVHPSDRVVLPGGSLVFGINVLYQGD